MLDKITHMCINFKWMISYYIPRDIEGGIYHIMAGRAFMVAKEVFHLRNGNILTLRQWLDDIKRFSFFLNSTISINSFTLRKILITENRDIQTHAITSPNVHWWANQERSCLLRTLTFCIIWIYQFIRQRLFLPSCNTHRIWLSLTNELQIDDYVITKFSFICEGQPCRVHITIYILTNTFDNNRHRIKRNSSDFKCLHNTYEKFFIETYYTVSLILAPEAGISGRDK